MAQDGASDRVNILGVGVNPADIPSALATFDQWIEAGLRRYVCVADVHTVVQAQWNPDFRHVLNGSGFTASDGMPLVWLCRLERGGSVKRVYGPDLLLAACRHGLERRRRHFFYGGAPGVAETLVARLQQRFPGLEVVGIDAPPFRPLSTEETEAVLSRINAARPDFLWVGLGAPKQEYWMRDHAPRLDVPVVLGVGAAFDFHAGTKPQAPRVIREAGFEWLFRLTTEPARLWPRYRRVIPAFVYRVALQKLGLATYTLDP